MFDTERIPMRIAKIEPRQIVKEDVEVALVEITLEINPLSAPLANELDEYVRRTLFTRLDGEVTEKLAAATFRLGIVPQAIVVQAAPDSSERFTIEEAKIGLMKAKRSKKTSTWRLEFTIRCAPASERQLAQMFDCYLKTRYCTFANAVPGLFDEEERLERRKRKTHVVEESAPTAH